MTNPQFDSLLWQFQQALVDCQELYLSSARLCVQQCPQFLPGSPESFVQLMDDLHKGLLIKIYVTIVEADQRWSQEEKRLGRVLFDHIWPGNETQGKLRDVAGHVFREARSLKWSSLVRPFAQMHPLRDHVIQLESVVMRLANLVAKADAVPQASELQRLREIQQELALHLRPVTAAPAIPSRGHTSPTPQAIQAMQRDTQELREQYTIHSDIEVVGEQQTEEERLAEALQQLDTLIGLQQVKHEIRTLTNFLNLQRQRQAQGLPATHLSLHLVFGGNPGTGKTTVARIVGQIYGSMGILSKGHLVETDRSGLVAEYAGQTGPKTNKRIDEALDGVLFIDEAYSLVAESGDDPYGREAVQALLKRMEDDRGRLVVVLAGYPQEMERLIRSNPGLSSRFNTKLTFEDYSPGELGRIFGGMCATNHYVVTAEAQARLILGFQWLYEHRDQHFGNGRLVRNLFENAIRRLANRIADTNPLTKELLTTLQADDIVLPDVPADYYARLGDGKLQFAIRCGGCGDVANAPPTYLGRKVRCKRCGERFVAEWGEPCET